MNRENKYCKLPVEIKNLLDDPSWMYEQYINLYKSIPTIAIELNISPSTVRKYINKHHISIRGQKKDNAIKMLGIEKYLKTRNHDWLYNEYVIQQKSIKTISIEHGIPYGTIQRALIREKIPIRDRSYKNHPYLGNREWLYLQYVVNNRDFMDIATELGVTNSTVSVYLHKHNIPIRTISESLSGELSSCWRGGLSFEPYCPKFNKDLKNRIRAFFNNTCILCGTTSNECGKQMSCHHVEYNKLACCDGKPVHFATLCPSCHGKTSNGDRVRWESIIHRIIDEVYNGKSYYTKEEYNKIQRR